MRITKAVSKYEGPKNFEVPDKKAVFFLRKCPPLGTILFFTEGI